VCHTHLHIDHAGKDDLFPMNTTVVLNARSSNIRLGPDAPEYPAPDIQHLIDRAAYQERAALPGSRNHRRGRADPGVLLRCGQCPYRRLDECACSYAEGNRHDLRRRALRHQRSTGGALPRDSRRRAAHHGNQALRSGGKASIKKLVNGSRFLLRCMTAPARSRAAMSSGVAGPVCPARLSSRCPSATGSRPEPGEGAAP